MKNQELNPELKKMLESLQDTPERDLQSSHIGREKYLTQVRNLKPRRRVSRKHTRQGKPLGRRTWVTRFAAIAAVLLVALSSLGGTIYAAQAAQPDDLLYGVKILTEEIQVNLETDPEEKLDLYVSFASRRLQEIQAQVAAGEEVSEKALALLEKHTQRMLEQATELDEFGMHKALRQIEENLQQQNQMMAELGKEHPQGGPPGLLKAQENIRERLELVKEGIKEPKDFKEKFNHHRGKSENPGEGKGLENNNPDDPSGQNPGAGTPGSDGGNGPNGN